MDPGEIRFSGLIKALVAAFLDGTGFEEKRRVLDHVAIWPNCAREFRVLTEL